MKLKILLYTTKNLSHNFACLLFFRSLDFPLFGFACFWFCLSLVLPVFGFACLWFSLSLVLPHFNLAGLWFCQSLVLPHFSLASLGFACLWLCLFLIKPLDLSPLNWLTHGKLTRPINTCIQYKHMQSKVIALHQHSGHVEGHSLYLFLLTCWNVRSIFSRACGVAAITRSGKSRFNKGMSWE